MKLNWRKVFAGVAAAAALTSVNIGAASPASAAIDVGGNCPERCLTLFYNTGYKGSRFVISYNGSGTNGIPNLAGYNFVTSGAGQGQPVKNNAASAYATFPGVGTSWVVYYNSGYGGACDAIRAYQEIEYAYQLVNTYNNNASARFLTYTPSDCYRFGS
ncbi:hypothetical protein ABT368_10555 [Streptomyces althioticus]|uniref:hypothetical protein n=1 Tax=Streptomyces althioticus TaxID=83380 RepID=UPI0018752CC1|nr:hypothetical protein GCM10010243_39790 [Streptomyces matensis]